MNYSTGTGTTGTGLTHPEGSKQGSKSGKESGSLSNQSGNGVESEGESDTQSDRDPFQVEEVGEPTLRKMFNVRFSVQQRVFRVEKTHHKARDEVETISLRVEKPHLKADPLSIQNH